MLIRGNHHNCEFRDNAKKEQCHKRAVYAYRNEIPVEGRTETIYLCGWHFGTLAAMIYHQLDDQDKEQSAA